MIHEDMSCRMCCRLILTCMHKNGTVANTSGSSRAVRASKICFCPDAGLFRLFDRASRRLRREQMAGESGAGGLVSRHSNMNSSSTAGCASVYARKGIV